MTEGRAAVDTATLRALADGLAGLAGSFRSGPGPGGPAVAAAAGDPVLAGSLHRFDGVADRARAELDDDLRRLADAVRLAADAYEEVERSSSARFGAFDRWLHG